MVCDIGQVTFPSLSLSFPICKMGRMPTQLKGSLGELLVEDRMQEALIQ